MKYLAYLLTVLVAFSCNKKADQAADKEQTKEEVEEIVAEAYGFKLKDLELVEDTIRSGDNLGKILSQNNLNANEVHKIIEKIKDSINVKNIRIGQPYALIKSKTKPQKLEALVYHPDIMGYYVLDLRDSVRAYKKIHPVTVKRRTIATTIDGSLSVSLQKQGVDQSLATKMSQIFAWSIDFFKLQKDDKFAVTIEEKYINDTTYVGIEKIEAAYFEYRGRQLYAFPYRKPGAKGVEYFDEAGKPMRSMFLKSPLKFFHITSRFTNNRFHPVQKRWKAHNGTDYAAPTGTAIMTTASGVVERTGYTAGNGNYVKVKHNGTYSTQYLHMSKILVRNGQSVQQGDVIGKVGSTGLATGPHVCYRFWKNGVQVDPLNQSLPNSVPMEKKELPAYLEHIKPLKRELDDKFLEKFAK
ncbi:peptidoglycan DD-metalloendopeptidase family protein [Flavobacterium sp. JP2137]|uniref:M23 family metallopeptidase n=1 Tax=Flavobacterium sp. JP2137 TaxID=3414510 RepID=UPI003D2FA497